MPDKLPSMPFFVSDYLSNTDVLLMSLAERGLYTHLLFRQWQDGRLEFNTRDLSILCACSEPEFIEQWEGIKHKFVTDSDGRIYNRRVEEVKGEYTRLREVRSEAGSKGGSKTQAKLKQTAKQSIKQTASKTSSKNQPPVQSIPVQSNLVKTTEVKTSCAAPSQKTKVAALIPACSNQEFAVTEPKQAEYQTTYPGVDVALELLAIRQWCLDNPTRQKTLRGVPRFLNAWLSKAQNSGRKSNKSQQTVEERLAELDAAEAAERKAP